jgi:hypothetical protein
VGWLRYLRNHAKIAAGQVASPWIAYLFGLPGSHTLSRNFIDVSISIRYIMIVLSPNVETACH